MDLEWEINETENGTAIVGATLKHDGVNSVFLSFLFRYGNDEVKAVVQHGTNIDEALLVMFLIKKTEPAVVAAVDDETRNDEGVSMVAETPNVLVESKDKVLSSIATKETEACLSPVILDHQCGTIADDSKLSLAVDAAAPFPSVELSLRLRAGLGVRSHMLCSSTESSDTLVVVGEVVTGVINDDIALAASTNSKMNVESTTTGQCCVSRNGSRNVLSTRDLVNGWNHVVGDRTWFAGSASLLRRIDYDETSTKTVAVAIGRWNIDQYQCCVRTRTLFMTQGILWDHSVTKPRPKAVYKLVLRQSSAATADTSSLPVTMYRLMGQIYGRRGRWDRFGGSCAWRFVPNYIRLRSFLFLNISMPLNLSSTLLAKLWMTTWRDVASKVGCCTMVLVSHIITVSPFLCRRRLRWFLSIDGDLANLLKVLYCAVVLVSHVLSISDLLCRHRLRWFLPRFGNLADLSKVRWCAIVLVSHISRFLCRRRLRSFLSIDAEVAFLSKVSYRAVVLVSHVLRISDHLCRHRLRKFLPMFGKLTVLSKVRCCAIVLLSHTIFISHLLCRPVRCGLCRIMWRCWAVSNVRSCAFVLYLTSISQLRFRLKPLRFLSDGDGVGPYRRYVGVQSFSYLTSLSVSQLRFRPKLLSFLSDGDATNGVPSQGEYTVGLLDRS